jgi:hypothetical protein
MLKRARPRRNPSGIYPLGYNAGHQHTASRFWRQPGKAVGLLGRLRMKPSDAFGVLIRAMGVWVVVQLIVNAPATINGIRSIVGLISLVAQVMLAYSLLFKADFVVSLVYPGKLLDDLAPMRSHRNQNDSQISN